MKLLPPEAAIKAPIAGPTDDRRNPEGVPRDGANPPAPPPGKARPYGCLSCLALVVICITALPLGCLLAWSRTRWGANAPEAPVVEPRLDSPPRATLSRPSFATSRLQAAALEPAPAPSTPREADVLAREEEQDEAAAAGDEAATPGDKDALTDLASIQPVACVHTRSLYSHP